MGIKNVWLIARPAAYFVTIKTSFYWLVDVGYGLDRTANDKQDVECSTGGSVKTEPYR